MRPNSSSSAAAASSRPFGRHHHHNNNNYANSSGGAVHLLPQSDSAKARLFLAIACFWPLVLWALFASSAPHVSSSSSSMTINGTTSSLLSSSSITTSSSLRNLLDRVDILGYGPMHPRIAAVIVGDANADNLVSSVESIFSYTDLNRIFIVVVVVDGHQYDATLVQKLMKIDSGAIPHWHGLRPDINNNQKGDPPEESAANSEEPHGRKVHVLFNPERLGVAASRADAVTLIDLLQQKHEEAGLKKKDEDLILLLLRSGTQLTSHKWLPMVTDALIVPPPLALPGWGDTSTAASAAGTTSAAEDMGLAMKLSNAVSFNLEGPGKRTSFDSTFTPLLSTPTPDEINDSNGASYPTPALNGAATAMRLETYLHLPSQDTLASLTQLAWPADLELTLNLWLCADGIDMLQGLTVTSFDTPPSAPLGPELAARFAAAWMDPVASRKFYNAYVATYDEVTFLEWETLQAKARHQPTFTVDLPKKCRSFQWYATEINPDLKDFLKQTEQILTAADDGDDDDTAGDGANNNNNNQKEGEGGEDENNQKNDKGDDDTTQNQQQQDQRREKDEEKKDDPADDPARQEQDNQNSDQANVGERKEANAVAGAGANENPAAEKKDSAGAGAEGVDGNVIPERHDKKKPSKPLCKACLEIVQKAEPIDISFVDVSDGHKEHPHMGATDSNGNPGYIHDETALRKNPPKMNFDEQSLRAACLNRDNNYKMLHEKVFVDLKADEAKQKAGVQRDKIFCLVYTIESGHPNVQRIRETWG